MPESACLHIQSRESDPVRVVDLAGASIRIGRAAYCEVRIAEDDVAEEECRLRRRGGVWHLVPGRAAGSVWIDGRSVAESCPLPFDVPFRVGEHWLTLRPTEASAPAWGSYDAPIPVEVPSASASVSEGFRSEPAPERGPVAAPSPPLARPGPPRPEERPDHLANWQDRQEQRSRLSRLGQDGKRWEERWKAAGERLRARTASTSPPARSPSIPPAPLPPKVRRTEPFDAPPAASTIIPKPDLIPRVSTALSTPEAFPTRVVTPAPLPSREPRTYSDWDDFAITPRGEPAPPPPAPSAFLRTVPESPPFSTDRESETIDESGAIAAPTAPTVLEVSPTSDIVEVPPELAPAPAPVPVPAPGAVGGIVEDVDPTFPATDTPSPGLREAVLSEASAPPEPTSPPVDSPRVADGLGPAPAREDQGWASHDPFVTDTRSFASNAAHLAARPDLQTTVHDVHGNGEGSSPSAHREPRPATPGGLNGRARDRYSAFAAPPLPAPTVERRQPEDLTSGMDSPRVQDAPTSNREWPRARDLFAAQPTRPVPEPSPRPKSRKVRSQPAPTVCCEPACWSLPIWLAWPPAVGASIVAATVGLALSWSWSIDARSAGLVANVLAQGEAEPKPLPEDVAPAGLSWLKATGGNLFQWVLYHDRRAGSQPDEALRARELLEVASLASPLQAQVRFARARLPRDDRGGDSLLASLGTSRDVVALSLTGHECLESGKKDAALKAYRAALKMAALATLERLGTPAYNDDPQSRRYELPGEGFVGAVVRDMAEHPGWTFADWSEALPPDSVAPLVAARLLREKGSPDVSKALDALIATGDSAPANPGTAAVLVAARAEAMALKGRLDEAEALYRRAIAEMPDGTIRRTWWINLADIAQRQNDEAKRLKALEAAKGTDLNDEVARRAVDLLKLLGSRDEKRRPKP